jgi:formylglycine-generating enzyme required for sulfatase activity
MKNISLLLLIVSLTGPLSAQKQTTHPSADSMMMHKHAPKTIAEVKDQPIEVIEAIEKNMVYIPAGGFTMGCPDVHDTSSYYWERPAHKVTVGSFYLSKFDVTQKQWEAVVGPNKYSLKKCADCPVENVSWYDAQVFINKLNQLTGKNYRLPTEAEWEYAARGGSKSAGYKYAGGNKAGAVAWISDNSGGQTHIVGQKKPNELGLYDMSGNVWQWCSDWFNDKYYSKSPADNPEGPSKGSFRVLRGGSWWSGAPDCRSENRDRYPADAKDDDVGFRLARD